MSEPDKNWESFLTGADGASENNTPPPPTVQKNQVYLDLGSPAVDLLGGRDEFSPMSRIIGDSRSVGLNSVLASPEGNSSNKVAAEAESTSGGSSAVDPAKETLEQKIARVMAGNYSVPGSSSASASTANIKLPATAAAAGGGGADGDSAKTPSISATDLAAKIAELQRKLPGYVSSAGVPASGISATVTAPATAAVVEAEKDVKADHVFSTSASSGISVATVSAVATASTDSKLSNLDKFMDDAVTNIGNSPVVVVSPGDVVSPGAVTVLENNHNKEEEDGYVSAPSSSIAVDLFDSHAEDFPLTSTESTAASSVYESQNPFELFVTEESLPLLRESVAIPAVVVDDIIPFGDDVKVAAAPFAATVTASAADNYSDEVRILSIDDAAAAVVDAPATTTIDAAVENQESSDFGDDEKESELRALATATSPALAPAGSGGSPIDLLSGGEQPPNDLVDISPAVLSYDDTPIPTLLNKRNHANMKMDPIFSEEFLTTAPAVASTIASAAVEVEGGGSGGGIGSSEPSKPDRSSSPSRSSKWDSLAGAAGGAGSGGGGGQKGQQTRSQQQADVAVAATPAPVTAPVATASNNDDSSSSRLGRPSSRDAAAVAEKPKRSLSADISSSRRTAAGAIAAVAEGATGVPEAEADGGDGSDGIASRRYGGGITDSPGGGSSTSNRIGKSRSGSFNGGIISSSSSNQHTITNSHSKPMLPLSVVPASPSSSTVAGGAVSLQWSFARRGDSAAGEGGSCSVRVAVRVRPFIDSELKTGTPRRIVSFKEDQIVIVNPNAFDTDPDVIATAGMAVNNKEWAQKFKFNNVLWSFDPRDDEDIFADQIAVHRVIGSEIVENVLNGVSCSCFAYGHTGAGKTYSMFGKISQPATKAEQQNQQQQSAQKGIRGKATTATASATPAKDKNTGDTEEEVGLIPRVLKDIITGLKRRDGACDDTLVTLSFMEIYNEKIRDLLGDADGYDEGTTAQPRVREHPVRGIYVENILRAPIDTVADALKLLSQGLSRRSTSASPGNPLSSRSHAVVTLELTPVEDTSSARSRQTMMFSPAGAYNKVSQPSSVRKAGQMSVSSSLSRSSSFNLGRSLDIPSASLLPGEQAFVRVQLVDLAGSETDNTTTARGRADEEDLDSLIRPGVRNKGNTPNSPGNHAALGAAEKAKETKLIRRSLSTLGYIIKSLGHGAAFKTLPYRDCVLTWLLRDSLNGSSHTTLLATISPSNSAYEETLYTLKFAERLCLLGPSRNFLVGDHGFAPFAPRITEGGEGEPSSPAHGVGVGVDVQRLEQQLRSGKKIAAAPGSGSGVIGGVAADNWNPHTALGNSLSGSNYRIRGNYLDDQTPPPVPPALPSKEESAAVRLLLKHTVADPQQRLAKMGLTGKAGVVTDGSPLKGTGGYGVSPSIFPHPGYAGAGGAAVLSDPAVGPDDMGIRDAYRSLHSQFVELQIELETARTDRDSLNVELKASRESIDSYRQGLADDQGGGISGSGRNGHGGSEWSNGPRTSTAVADLMNAMKAANKELAEVRGVLARKEEALDRLLAEVADEKQARAAIEHGAKAQAIEFLQRVDALQREKQSADIQLENAQADIQLMALELSAIREENDKLVKVMEEQRQQLETLPEQLAVANETIDKLHGDLQAVKSEKMSVDTRCRDLEQVFDRLKEEMVLLAEERNAMSKIIDQQEANLHLQQVQGDAKIRALQQQLDEAAARASAVIEYQPSSSSSRSGVAEDELSRLQGSLSDMLSQGKEAGAAMQQDELADAQRLISVIDSVRQRLQESESLREELSAERALRTKLQTQAQAHHTQPYPMTTPAAVHTVTVTSGSPLTVPYEIHTQSPALAAAMAALPAHHQQLLQQQQLQHVQLMEQLTQQRGATESAEGRAQYWQQVAQKATEAASKPNEALTMANETLREENGKLKNSLAASQEAEEKSRNELKAAQDSMQREFASLWMAVQELNKLDAVKEKAMQDLVSDRDHVLREKEELQQRLDELTDSYENLQKELVDIDNGLLEVMDANVDDSEGGLNNDHDHHQQQQPQQHSRYQSVQPSYAAEPPLPLQLPPAHYYQQQQHGGGGRGYIPPPPQPYQQQPFLSSQASVSSANNGYEPAAASGARSPPGGASVASNRGGGRRSNALNLLPSLPAENVGGELHSRSSSPGGGSVSSLSHKRAAPRGSGGGPSEYERMDMTVSEKVLEKQIMELSEFLESDRAKNTTTTSQQKRVRLRSSSSSGAGSSASVTGSVRASHPQYDHHGAYPSGGGGGTGPILTNLRGGSDLDYGRGGPAVVSGAVRRPTNPRGTAR